MKIKSKLQNSIIKKSKSKSYFPLLSVSPEKTFYNKNNQNSFLLNKNNDLSNSLNDSFIQRNYQNFIDEEKAKTARLKTNILKKNDLETILFNLKKNYNLITTITQQGNSELNKLSNSLKTEEDKLNKLIDFKEIELPDEKISLRKLGDTNMTKEQLNNNLFELLNEKRDLDEKVNIANEYTKTVEYMLVGEKKKLVAMQEETTQILEKLNNYARYNTLINENLRKTKLKNSNYSELSKQLINNIELANNIINDNNEKNQLLENRIKTKEENVDKLKETLTFMKGQNKENFIKYKEDNYEKICKTKEDQEEKTRKEKKYVDIIYCLYVLQKYFIEKDQFNSEHLLQSKEYNAILNDNYDIDIKEAKDDDSINAGSLSVLNIQSQQNENNNNSNMLYKSSKELIKTNTKYKSNTIPLFKVNKNSSKNQVLSLRHLKDILNEININKDKVFDYISKLSAKISLYQNNLNNLHAKEISLNDKKHDYFERVKKIISENFLNFEELIKNNSRFELFLVKNKFFIDEMKMKNRENNLDEIDKRLNSIKFEIENSETHLTNQNNMLTKEEIEKFNKEQHEKLNKEQMRNNANELYKKCNDLILKINYYLDNNLDIMNNIENTIQNNLKSSKNESEENSKIDLSGFINLVENEKDKIIDFKNLNIQKIQKDSSFFIEYLKKLIEYNKKYLKEKIDENDLKNNLLGVLLYNEQIEDNNINNKNNINQFSFDKFISSTNISLQNNIYNQFYTSLEQTENIIKSILNFIKNNQNFVDKYESSKINEKTISKSILSNTNSLLLSAFANVKAQIKANTLSKKNKIINKPLNKKEDFDSLWVEDKDTSLDTKSIKNEEKIFKKKFNKKETNIMNHLYNPSFEKTNYLRRLNLEMKNIKNLTLNNSKFNFIMNQKRNEIDLMSNQMQIYNNPGIHPNDLSIPMYNNINNLIIQKRRINGQIGKRLKSTILKRRPKYKL